MGLSFGRVEHVVRQTLHLRQTERPSREAPGERPGLIEKLLDPMVVKTNPFAPPPPAAPKAMKIMSFNVRLGGMDYAGVQRTLVEKRADVICLQEVSRETAERLARALGLHLAFYQSVRHNNALNNGKAILSRYPIKEAESRPFEVSAWGRLKAMWHGFKRAEGGLRERLFSVGSLWQKRSLLRATIVVGGKQVDVIDVHLTTGRPEVAAAQQDQLRAYVAKRRRTGREVVVAGDFNTRMDLAPETGPDTRAWARLKRVVADAYERGEVWIRGLDGKTRTPGEAIEALRRKDLDAADRDVLARTARGATTGSGSGRIDAVLASEGLRPTRVEIDQANAASDHEPVVATFELPAARAAG